MSELQSNEGTILTREMVAGLNLIGEDGVAWIPSYITVIDSGVFAGNKTLETVIFEPDSKLNGIGSDAFKGCENLKSIHIPAGVRAIGNHTFEDCANLRMVNFVANSQLRVIGKKAFQRTGLVSVEIPSSVKFIGISGFAWCKNLTKVVFGPDSQLGTIGASVFGDSAISTIEIPKKVRSIEYKAFGGCKNLARVIFEKGSSLQMIGRSAFSHTKITSIEIPDSVQKIGGSAFAGCWLLSRVAFGQESALHTIEFCAFSGTGIITFTIPEGVHTLGNNTFVFCRHLEEVTFLPPSYKLHVSDDFREDKGKIYAWGLKDYPTNVKRVHVIKGSEVEKVFVALNEKRKKKGESSIEIIPDVTRTEEVAEVRATVQDCTGVENRKKPSLLEIVRKQPTLMEESIPPMPSMTDIGSEFDIM